MSAVSCSAAIRAPARSPVRSNAAATTTRCGPADRGVVSSRCRAANRASASSGRPELSSMAARSEEHTSELQSRGHLVCRLLLEKKNKYYFYIAHVNFDLVENYNDSIVS